ncbi:YncE family protein [Maribacter litoralis]|uniref:YncE family protein n=1 Tax=Maribacter litoralis TaxID=2059726 RepID=UPI003D267D56
MKNHIIILLFAIVMVSCKENKKETDSTIVESKVIAQDIASPIINVGKGPDALFLTPNKSFLYVANVEDTLVSVIDTQTDQNVKSINGIKYPWGFTRLAKSNLVAVSGYDKQLVIIDFTNHSIVNQNVFKTHLGGIASDKEGKFIYVIAIDDNKVLQLNSKTLKIVNTFSTGKGPDGIGISKDDSTLFVTNTEDGTISVINILSNTQKIIETGGKPELIHYNKDHSLLYISNFLKNKIHIIDTEKGEIVKEIENIKTPEEAVLSEDEKLLYVVSFDSGELNVYDASTLEKQSITYKTGNKPIGVMPLGNKLYVSNYGDNSISVIKK